MGQQLIDQHTADRLLSGVLAPEDVPPGVPRGGGAPSGGSHPAHPEELASCATTVAAMAKAVAAPAPVPSSQTRRRAGLTRLLRPRIAATLTAGALVPSFGGPAESDGNAVGGHPGESARCGGVSASA